MNIQIKKGLLELLVLSLLRRKDSYGYELMIDVINFVSVSESTIYPILSRLEKSSLLTTYNIEYEGRLRKYYKITKAGLEKLKNSQNDWKIIKDVYKEILGDEYYE